jgi:uncharacterized protein (TIGR02611 family)
MMRREKLQQVHHRVRSTRTGRVTIQVTVALIGAVVVAIGIVLIPFPGPGWLIVLAGLAIWAIEFVWAQRLLQFTRTQLERWWHWLGRQNLLVRFLTGAVGLVVVGAVVWTTIHYSLGVRSLPDLWDRIRSLQ